MFKITTRFRPRNGKSFADRCWRVVEFEAASPYSARVILEALGAYYSGDDWCIEMLASKKAFAGVDAGSKAFQRAIDIVSLA